MSEKKLKVTCQTIDVMKMMEKFRPENLRGKTEINLYEGCVIKTEEFEV